MSDKKISAFTSSATLSNTALIPFVISSDSTNYIVSSSSIFPTTISDNALIRVDGTNTIKYQPTSIIVSDTNVMTGVNGISVGSGYSAISPPTNGVIIQGILATGTSTPNAGCQSHIGGTIVTEDAADKQYGAYSATSFAPTNGTTLSTQYRAEPTFAVPAAQVIATGACFSASPQLTGNAGTLSALVGYDYDGGGSLIGTVSVSYGSRIKTPVAGTIKIAAYNENLVVGNSYISIAPPANGVIIEGNIGIGTSSATNLVTIGTTNTALGEAIRINGDSSQNYLSFYNNTTRQGYLGTYSSGSGIVLNSDTAGGLTLQVSGSNKLTFITNATNRATVNTGVSIGSSFYSINAPADGLIVQGYMAVGVSSTSYPLLFNPTFTGNQIGFFSGTLSCNSYSQAYSFNSVQNAVDNVPTGIHTYFNPTVSVSSGKTIDLYATIYIESGSQSGAGAITTGYSLYINTPNIGTTKYAAYLGGVCIIGAGGTTPQHYINSITTTGASAGTLLNCPVAGNATGYLQIYVNGTQRYIPFW